MGTWRQTLINSDFDPEGIITNVPWFHDDDNLWAWYDTVETKYNISANLGWKLTLDGSDCATKFYSFNGNRYYTQGSYYIWFDSENLRWTINTKLGFATDETEDGDVLWYSDTKTGTYTASAEATGTKVVAEVKNGWQSDQFIGEYTAIGTEDGIKIIGTENLEITIDSNVIEYVESGEWSGQPYYVCPDEDLFPGEINKFYYFSFGTWRFSSTLDGAVYFGNPDGTKNGTYWLMGDPSTGNSLNVDVEAEYLADYKDLDIRIANVGLWQ